MPVWVMVTADFPSIVNEPAKRLDIYKCLEDKDMKKITEPKRDISTVWSKYFSEDIKDDVAKERARQIFIECAKKYNAPTPKLVIHAGALEPTVF